LSIIRLLGSGLLEEGNKGEDININLRAFTVNLVKVANVKNFIKNQLILLYISFLRPVIVNIHIRDKLSKDRNPIIQANSIYVIKLGFNPNIIIWETVFNTFLEIKCKRI